MSHQADVHELRQAIVDSTLEVEVSEQVVDSARFAFKTMVNEAGEFGLSEADVIRAIFRPVFRKEKGCNCFSCTARRGDNDALALPGRGEVRMPKS